MPADPSRSSELEIAHVLFMDLVGYSRLFPGEQVELHQRLQGLVRDTAEFRRAHACHELICLPSGDGMALVFFRDPAAPVQCALEIGAALQRSPQMKLRMGIHSGPVHRVEDINANLNVSGGGINLAQRVMDCGDAGHILLSSTVAELISQLGDWSVALHDLGQCEVKHGLRLHLFSLYTDEIGNRELPLKLQGAPAVGAPPAGELQHVQPSAGSRSVQRVALLYKRHAQPDEQLLSWLEKQLVAQECAVFIDRHLAIGVEWAREIEREIRTADAVIPLLSPASMQSEMLAYELQIAQEAAQQQQGRPRILPVRIMDTGPLPEPLAAVLAPLNYAVWDGPQDNDRLLADLVEALRSPLTSPPASPPRKLEPVGGALPLTSAFYVVRSTDEEFSTAIARQDSIVLIKGARQMGKTSLLARGLQQAREAGARVILTDFQMLNTAHLQSAETLLFALAEWIAEQLDLDTLADAAWDARRGPSMNLQRYLRREVLEKIAGPVVWGLDEVDRLFECDFGSEIFGLFRSWHNARSLDPSGPWSRLSLAIAYATEAHLFITDVNQSPFNVGTRLTLQDFTLPQVADLNRRYGSPLRDETEIARYYRLVGGHPYLVQRGLHEMAAHALNIAAFEAQADRDEGVFGDHLRRILVLLVKDTELCDAVRAVLRDRPCPAAQSFYRLRSGGVLTGDTLQDARPRCQLYAAYLKRHLL